MNSSAHQTLRATTLRRVALAATLQSAVFYQDYRKSTDPFVRRLAQVSRAAAVTKFDQIINGETR